MRITVKRPKIQASSVVSGRFQRRQRPQLSVRRGNRDFRYDATTRLDNNAIACIKCTDDRSSFDDMKSQMSFCRSTLNQSVSVFLGNLICWK